MAKEIFMGTTQIPASKTIGQISETLRRYGVSGVTQRYGPDGLVESVEFSVSRNGQEFAFMLPARVDAVFRTIHNRRKSYQRSQYAKCDREQAERTAWRQILRWVEAQMALMETGQVQLEEVFLPYMVNDVGQTMFQAFESSQIKALPASV
jgi:hypothetical protein